MLLHLLLALAPAMAQNVAYTGGTTKLEIVPVTGETYSWELYDNGSVDFATTPGNCPATSADFVSGNVGASVDVKWLKPGIYFFKVTAWNITGCTNNIKVGIIEVKIAVKATIEASPVVCAGETVTLTVTLEGNPPWEYTYTDGTNSWTVSNVLTSPSVITLTPGPVITTDYWITLVKDQYGTNTTPSEKATQQVNPLPAPSLIYHR